MKSMLSDNILNFIKIILSPVNSFYSHKLKKLIASRRVVIIPAGFRCFTKERLYPKLGICQASLPFDSGFFPPYAVAEIIKNQRVDLKINDASSQTVCIKSECYHDSKRGLGIKFETTSYAEINCLAKNKKQKDINKYLDSTFGYYTLDVKNDYVLAHYNWHEFADAKHSNGHTEPAFNLVKINELMNRRIQRLMGLCEKAEIIFFIYDETQHYNFMAINNTYFDLNDLDPIEDAAKSTFKAKSFVMKSKGIESARDMIEIIRNHL